MQSLGYYFVLEQRDATYQIFSDIYKIKSLIKLRVYYDEDSLCYSVIIRC